ncbi:transcriptional regulator domain-containing protein [Mesorhizobium sp. ORS 3428]|uniref:transcriptional regulator domain-containing protein n=1 Tax=Mesorhizobium sp. ORS 3428 TaxID=540997 RepID=UPI003FCD0D5A
MAHGNGTTDEPAHGVAWPDWQDTSTYDYTAQLTARGWAWEFLRRNPDFQNDLAPIVHRARCTQTDSGDSTIRLPKSVDLSRWGLLFCKFDWK